MYLQVPHLAVFFGALASFFIGMFWYSPVLFGNIWMKLSGINQKDVAKTSASKMASLMIANFLATVIFGYVVAFVVQVFTGATYVDTLLISTLLWIGFVCVPSLNRVLWENSPVRLFILNNSYWLIVTFVVVSIIYYLP